MSALIKRFDPSWHYKRISEVKQSSISVTAFRKAFKKHEQTQKVKTKIPLVKCSVLSQILKAHVFNCKTEWVVCSPYKCFTFIKLEDNLRWTHINRDIEVFWFDLSVIHLVPDCGFWMLNHFKAFVYVCVAHCKAPEVKVRDNCGPSCSI